MTRRRWLLIALAAAAVILLAGRMLAQMYVDHAWYAAMGAAAVWRARLGAVLTLRVASWLIATAFVFVNLYVVRHSVVSLVLPRRVANLEIGEEVPPRYLMWAVIALAVILGGLLTLPQDDWSSYVLARGGVPFGESDPYFGADLGFFVYWLPFEIALHTWTLISVLIVSVLVVFLYALTPSLRWERGTVYVSAYVRRHLTVLAGVLLLMIAWSDRLDMYGILMQGSGADGAFAYVDHVVGIPGSLVLAIVTMAAAIIVVWGGWTGQLRLAGAAILGVLVLSLGVRQVAPWVAARWGDADPLVRERPYEATRAGYTRRAFGVERIARADTALGFADLRSAAQRVSVWDGPAIIRAVEGSRPVVVVGDAIGWRSTPSGLVAEMAEQPVRATAPERGPWSVTRVLAWGADDRGGIIRTSASGLPTTDESLLAPPVVFDSAGGYMVIADTVGGIIGTRLDDWVARLAHAWSFQKPALLFGDLPQPRPTVVDHRDARERLRLLVPFFAQGSSITPIIAADTLYWGVDLYSASATYPLSRHAVLAGDERSYFQHAATAVIIAATGQVMVVADSLLDPIAMSWVRRFPTLFSDWGALPPSVRQAMPPAMDGIRAQALAFGRYGTRTDSHSPTRLPVLDGADAELQGPVPPFVLPGTGATAVALPLIDTREQLQGLMIGTGGVRRTTLWMPLDSAPRWPALLDRLTGVASSAAADADLGQGPVRVFPLAGGAGYVESSYRIRPGAPATLAHVTIVVNDSARTGPTLAEMSGAANPSTLDSEVVTTPAAFRARVEALYAAMRDALRRGDWEAFGRAFDSLGKLVPEGIR